MIVLDHQPYKFLMIVNLKYAPFCHRAEAYFYAKYTPGFLAETATNVIRATLNEAAPIPGYLGELIASVGEVFEEGEELCIIGCSKSGKSNLMFGTRTDVLGEMRAYFIRSFERHGGYDAALHIARLNERPALRAVA